MGSYECFTFYSEDGTTEEILYQTIYLYVDGAFDELSAPIDHIYKKKTDEVFTILAKLGEHIILPCRPVHPNVTVELYRQDKRPNERIVDSISNINAKVFSTKFYHHHLTPLFYYHPRIGFVLDSVTEEDKGKYHCLCLLYTSPSPRDS